MDTIGNIKRSRLNLEVTNPTIDAVRADLEAALAIAAKAALIADPDTRKLARAYARNTFLHLRDELWPLRSSTAGEGERTEISAKLEKLKRRLERVGERFG